MKLNKTVKTLIIAAIWLLIWEAVSLAVGKEVLFPSPVRTCSALIHMACGSDFWLSIGISILRILIGYFTGIICGFILGLLCSLSKLLDSFLSPLSHVIRATPVASFILLLFVFLARNNIPAFTAFLMVFPVSWANIYEGIKSTDKKQLEMAKVFRLSKDQILRKIYFPTLLPFFLTSVKTGMGLAWKAAIAAEVLVNPEHGIGSGLYNSKIYLETPELFAWTLVIIIISLILEKLLIKIISRLGCHY